MNKTFKTQLVWAHVDVHGLYIVTTWRKHTKNCASKCTLVRAKVTPENKKDV